MFGALMSDYPIDPTMLLSSIRHAIALDHRAVALMSFATLDAQLSGGGELPDDWKPVKGDGP
jgi:hypothetical protein